MKKILSFLVIFIVFLIPINVYADDASVSIEVVGKVEKDSTIEILVNLKGVEEFYAASVDFTYDTNQLDVKSIEATEFITKYSNDIMELGGETAKNGNTASYSFTFLGDKSGISGAGTLVKITANVLENGKLSINQDNMKIKLVHRVKDTVENYSYNFSGYNVDNTINKPSNSTSGNNSDTTNNSNSSDNNDKPEITENNNKNNASDVSNIDNSVSKDGVINNNSSNDSSSNIKEKDNNLNSNDREETKEDYEKDESQTIDSQNEEDNKVSDSNSEKNKIKLTSNKAGITFLVSAIVIFAGIILFTKLKKDK